MTLTQIIIFLVRCAMVALFLPFSAADKILHFKSALAQSQEVFKPRPLALFALLCGLGIEVFMSLGVVSGFADRACALVLAVYCAATALLFKRFWRAPADAAEPLFWDFWKNLALGAGFLLITFGTNGAALDAFIAHPLQSSHPYAPASERP